MYSFGSSYIFLVSWSDEGSLGKSIILGREWGSSLEKFVSLVQKLQILPHSKKISMHILKI